MLIPKGITHRGEWAVDEMKVRVVDDFTAWISYEKYIINAERYSIAVKVSWFERRKGITLESKIQQRFNELKTKLENENKKIREYKRIEESFK